MVAEPSPAAAHGATGTTDRLTPPMAALVEHVTAAVEASTDPVVIAPRVAEALRAVLPVGASLLTSMQCLPDCERYCQHVAYVDPAGRFSVVSLVWLPGQATPVHDHACWCVVGVVLGREEETRFRPIGDEPLDRARLRRTGRVHNEAGAVCWLVPPEAAATGRRVASPDVRGASGDIHQVRAISDGVTISIHVYGDDIAARGSSIRRVYGEDRLSDPASAHPAPFEPADGAGKRPASGGPTAAVQRPASGGPTVAVQRPASRGPTVAVQRPASGGPMVAG